MRQDEMERIAGMVRTVEQDPAYIGVLSTGERCAVALILDKPELLARGDTMLYAAQRLDSNWLAGCWKIQRDGWKP